MNADLTTSKNTGKGTNSPLRKRPASAKSFGIDGKSSRTAPSLMDKSKSGYKAAKDHGRTLQEIRGFSKPNLDDGN